MVKLVECHRIIFDTKRLFERLGINQELNPKIMGVDDHGEVTILSIQRDSKKLNMKMTEEDINEGIKELVDNETYKKHLEFTEKWQKKK